MALSCRCATEETRAAAPADPFAHDQIKKRGAAPLGGGQVIFKCPVVRNVKTLNFVDGGKIKRIRGIACVAGELLLHGSS